MLEILNHSEAIKQMIRFLTDPVMGTVGSIRDIHGVGHRVVHGGEAFTAEVRIDEQVKQQIRELYDLATLHNPGHMVGITAVEEQMEGIPRVAVFDTAFHETMQPFVYLYPIPRVLYRKHGIRRYGFHGTSHEYVAHKAADLLGAPLASLKIISCHIGNGASCTAIDAGLSVDTSMGMTPLEGLMMGTRSGDLDPAIIPFLISKEELAAYEVNAMLNKHSGLLAVSGMSGDVRELLAAIKQGDPNAKLAIDMYEYRIRKYIGAYAAAMDGVDAIIFTGGVGENSAYLRDCICRRLTYLGLELDPYLNEASSAEERVITTPGSLVKALVIPTNEELMIARKTFALLGDLPTKADEQMFVGG